MKMVIHQKGGEEKQIREKAYHSPSNQTLAPYFPLPLFSDLRIALNEGGQLPLFTIFLQMTHSY